MEKTLELRAFDTFLKEHLAQWFAGGFLDLQQVKWQETSADQMEKVRLNFKIFSNLISQ